MNRQVVHTQLADADGQAAANVGFMRTTQILQWWEFNPWKDELPIRLGNLSSLSWKRSLDSGN